MKLAKILWATGSVLINIVIFIYIYLTSNAPKDTSEKYAYLNENWSIYEAHWKAELLIMTMITIGAVYFAIHLKKISWSIISVGQLILLTMYPIMLGGYRNTPLEIAEMANNMAIIIFIFGNLTFFSGLLYLYVTDTILKKRLRIAAIILSSIAVITFTLVFIGLITWKQALVTAPLMNILYIINAYYGLQLKAYSVKNEDRVAVA